MTITRILADALILTALWILYDVDPRLAFSMVLFWGGIELVIWGKK